MFSFVKNCHAVLPKWLYHVAFQIAMNETCYCSSGFPHSSVGKESACSAGDLGLIPGSGRSPGGGNGNPLQYSCLDNPMDRGAFSFDISPYNEYLGLISFRIDWLDLCAVQGTLKSLLQHHSSQDSIFLCSSFFIVQLSHPYMTTGKTIP